MNKVILTFLLAILITVIPHLTAISQALYPVSLDEKVQQSTLIVEGKVKSKTSFWNTTHTMIYTANTIEIYKVFKGNPVIDTIEIMTQGGSVNNFGIEVSDLLDLNKGDIGMFFCIPNQINLKSPLSNKQLWDVYSSAQGCFKYNLAKGSAAAPFINYEDIQGKLYPELEQKTLRQPQIINKLFKPYSQQLFRLLAGPVISSFSPAMVKAGSFSETSENTLTINGSGFGTASGSAGINFDNPDDGTGGTPYFVAATSDLIISWTNTQIVVKVPAKAGTGTFSVVEAGGSSGNSPSALQVKYAILNATFGSAPTLRQFSLMNVNGSGGYGILYSTNTSGGGADFTTSAYKPAFERALTTWNEVGGLNFVYAGTTTTQTVNAGDGINIIMLDNTNTGLGPISAGVLAITYSSGLSCSGSQYLQRTGFDMVIRNPGVSTGTYNFNFGPCKTSTATTEFDLENTLLHELGHALNLGHINDSYTGTFPNIDPAKLMNFAIVNGADRRSPDWSSLQGAQYCINPRGLLYGGCTAQTEMIPLVPFIESKDECPVTFPSSATPANTFISFDLNHATSNKNGDPQLTAVNCTGTGTAITNNAYYAIKTGSTGGTLTVNVSGYNTTPSTQQSCSGAGVELALYKTSSCPAGQSFPTPVACRTFNANGTLVNFTGLLANTNYLFMVDGISNTKANFSLLINGAALPLKLEYFTGTSLSGYNMLKWKIENGTSVDKLILEGSIDGTHFMGLYAKTLAATMDIIDDSYNDYNVTALKYYRLKIFNNKTGSAEYSNIILLKQNTPSLNVLISPNPVIDYVNIAFYKTTAGPVKFNLHDMSGKLLNTENIIAVAGEQNVRLSIVKGIAKGIYTLQINTGESSSSYKILVQ